MIAILVKKKVIIVINLDTNLSDKK